MNKNINLTLASLEDTAVFARTLAGFMVAGDLPATLLLQGDLGAGKTTLCRYFVESLPGGDKSEVSSPSFTLCNEYPTSPPVLHFDLYRMEPWQDDENVLDALEASANGEVITLVEWSENLKKELFPENFLLCALTGGQNNRTAFLECVGTKASCMEKLHAALSTNSIR